MADFKKTDSYDQDIKNENYLPEADDYDQGLGVVLPQSLVNLSEEELAAINKRVTRKIDWLIMPAMVILYILNYLDRQNIASARLAGLTEDLNLTVVQYQTCISVLFAGYIAFQVPSNMIVAKIKYPALYICIACALWGIVSAGTGLVQNYSHLVVCRCILGIVEAVFFPGAIYFLSCWYTRGQFAFRCAVLYSGSQIGNAFGGLLAIAILKMDGLAGLEGWRWLFILEGLVTVVLGLACILVLPNTPATAKRLSQVERDALIYRLEAEKGAKDNSDQIGVGRALWMAIVDVKTWLMCGILFFTYVAAAVTNFFPSVVGTLGYSRNITYCLTAPPYLICVVCIMLNGMHSDKTGDRYWHVVLPLGVTMIANVIAVSTLSTAGRYVAMCLMPASFYSSAIVTLSWISGSASGSAVKRACVLSLINALCNTPNIWTSYLYKNAPRYLVAFSVNLAASVVAICFATAALFYLKKENAKIERGDDLGSSGPTPQQIAGGFKYPL
ncbi:major facilitator superfamily domain-containing protein [Mrakia frigida]|uniref:major facilitator superfamily domain-containing protein n=1 Tax=Mrakia frigida TaxID=29902 RepID=UPI003FCC26B2